jgi:hypothetical protein
MKKIIKNEVLKSAKYLSDKKISNFSTLTALTSEAQETVEGAGFFYDMGRALSAKFCGCNLGANDGFHDDMSGWTR